MMTWWCVVVLVAYDGRGWWLWWFVVGMVLCGGHGEEYVVVVCLRHSGIHGDFTVTLL